MAIHRMFRIEIIGDSKFLIKDTIAEDELFDTRLYLIKVSTSDVKIFLNFIVHHTEDAYVEIYQNPIVTLNGILLSGTRSPTTLDIYSGPTTTEDGELFYSIDQEHVRRIDIHDLSLTANTDYLIKFIPHDLDYSTLS